MNWPELIKYSTVPLRKLDDNNMPCGIGSGCLFDFKVYRFLLTVFHVAEKSAKWCAQLQFNDEVQKTEVLYLNEFSFIGDFTQDKKSITDVEFSFHPVPNDLKCFFHHRTRDGKTIELKERPVLTLNDVGEPDKQTYYGFSGEIKPTSIPDLSAFETEIHIYHGLKYDRFENDRHYFKMPEKHPGHEWFRGCSGAPIIGENGKVVSLVCGGCTEKNEIYGNNLQKCMRTLDCFIE